jgi:hypothetical protein
VLGAGSSGAAEQYATSSCWAGKPWIDVMFARVEGAARTQKAPPVRT